MENGSHFGIRFWKEDDRPREKLLLKGRNSLSDAELIAILIGSGSKYESAVALSQRILQSVDNSLMNLGRLSVEDFSKFKGIGPAKAISVIAAMELGRRRHSEDITQLDRINSSESVFLLMQPILGELKHEEFWVIYLNNSNKILKKVQLSKGGITGTVVDIRIVMKKAIQLGAVAVILVHNHPSGALKASQPDLDLTKKIVTAGRCLDIKVLDHLIITEKAYFSFADEQLL